MRGVNSNIVYVSGFLLIAFLFLTGCRYGTYSINTLEKKSPEFEKSLFTSQAQGFSINYPKGWQTDEELPESDTLQYYFLASSPSDMFVSMNIFKLKSLSDDPDNDFDQLMDQVVKKVSNISIMEKSEIRIDGKPSKTVFLTYTSAGNIATEEIDIFIEGTNNSNYWIGLISEKDDQTDDNLAMLVDCAKTFQLLR